VSRANWRPRRRSGRWCGARIGGGDVARDAGAERETADATGCRAIARKHASPLRPMRVPPIVKRKTASSASTRTSTPRGPLRNLPGSSTPLGR
jgi:hypothetical protein